MKTLILVADSQGLIDVPHTSYGFAITPAYKLVVAAAWLEASNFHQGEPGAYPATVVFENGDSREMQRRENYTSSTLVPRFKLRVKPGTTWRISLYEHPGELLGLMGEGELVAYRLPGAVAPGIQAGRPAPWESQAPETVGLLVEPHWEALHLYFNNSNINEEESTWTGEYIDVYVASTLEAEGIGSDRGWTKWKRLSLQESRVHLLSELPRGRRLFFYYPPQFEQLGAGTDNISFTTDALVRVG